MMKRLMCERCGGKMWYDHRYNVFRCNKCAYTEKGYPRLAWKVWK